MPTLSVIILSKNVEGEITPALVSSQFADEIILVDTGSTDKTIEIAKKHKVRIVHATGDSFAKWRNDGAKTAKSDWILYLDSDERIPKKLANEIIKTISSPTKQAYTISRFEVFLGKHLPHWPDPRVLRLIKKDSLVRWEGKLHEQPKINGAIGDLENQMVHLSHKNIDEKIASTLNWSHHEAKMLFDSGHPHMVWWRFLRIMFTEAWDRAVKQGLWKDGTEGWIEIIYQMFSRYITYVRLWEMQRKPSLKETYHHIDKQTLEEWK